MKCPVCGTADLAGREMESGLLASGCPDCGGNWINSFQYWKWREVHGPDLPERPPEAETSTPVDENGRGKLCPECGHILLPYKVGHDLPFSLDRCGNCGGMWFDGSEWEALRGRNLHDDVHFIFGRSWQAEVAKREREATHEEILRARFGGEDLEQLRRIKVWLESHPSKDAMLAFLLHPENTNT